MSTPVRTAVQIAWVTDDVDAAEKALTNLLGVRKWVRIPEVHFASDTTVYRGRPTEFVASISLSYLQDMQLELIEPVRGGANIYSDFLRDRGAGLHHICTEVADEAGFDAALENAVGHGAEIVAQGVMPGGLRFAYVADAGAGVPFLEIALIPDEVRNFFDYIKREQ